MMNVLKEKGFLVTITGKISPHPKPGVQQFNFLTDSSNYTKLDSIKALVDEGKLKPHVQQAFPLHQVPAAFNVSQHGQVAGKLGVCVTEGCGDN